MRVLACIVLACAGFAQTAPVRVVLVGDSTVTDEAGWGAGFRQALPASFECINLSRGGRSSKSFRNEGHWKKALAEHPNYILIQFGHNDCPGKGPERETDPDTTFRDYMSGYVDEARAAGARPILVTSLVRRNIGADGRIVPDALVRYAAAVRRLAADKEAPLIDLYSLSVAMVEEIGLPAREKFGRLAKDGKMDNTHLGPEGSRIVGAVMAREFQRILNEKH